MRIAVAATIREEVLRSPARFWRPEDFSGSPVAVARALARLEGQGVLKRIRRGLYWRGQQTRLGMAPPDPSALVTTLVGSCGVGPAGSSAALQLGLTTQFPVRPEIAAPFRPPTGIAGIAFRDRTSRVGRLEADLASIEVAIFEVLEEWDDVVELPTDEAISEIVTVLRMRVRVDRLARAAKSERPVVRERLRALLRRAGYFDEAESIAPARSEHPRRVANSSLAA